MREQVGIELRNAGIGYGRNMLVSKADAFFRPSSITALIGRNGAGKSTLLRAIAGLRKFDEGGGYISGEEIEKMSPAALAKLISFVTTERTRIPYMNCRAIVAAGRSPYTDWRGVLSDADNAIVDHSLERVGMTHYASRSMVGMSDGECQRIMIARALAQDTPIILLDEPTSFLDLPGRWESVELLRGLARDEGKCIVYSTHELDIALRLADEIALIAEGRLMVDTPESLKSEGILTRVFGDYCK